MAVAFLSEEFLPHPQDKSILLPGGCAFYRCAVPAKALGTDAFGRPVFDPARGFGVRVDTDLGRFGFRTVVLKLLMDNWIPTAIRQAQALGQRIVIDVDDYYEGIPEGNLARESTSAEANKIRNREHYLESILLADTITVSTPFLRDHYAKQHPDVVLVRNSLMPGMFTRQKVRNRKPVIGWVGGVSWKSDDLAMLRDWLPDFLEDNDLMFHHSGDVPEHPSFAEVTGVNPARVTTLPMTRVDEYPLLFTPIDIGIVPLASNNFNAAKSFLKGLEYAASGIPFVADPTPEYLELARKGTGLIATSPDEWVEKLTSLLDYKTRRRAAAVNAAMADEHWSFWARAREWSDVLG